MAKNLSYPDLDGAENVGHDKDVGNRVTRDKSSHVGVTYRARS